MIVLLACGGFFWLTPLPPSPHIIFLSDKCPACALLATFYCFLYQYSSLTDAGCWGAPLSDFPRIVLQGFLQAGLHWIQPPVYFAQIDWPDSLIDIQYVQLKSGSLRAMSRDLSLSHLYWKCENECGNISPSKNSTNPSSAATQANEKVTNLPLAPFWWIWCATVCIWTPMCAAELYFPLHSERGLRRRSGRVSVREAIQRKGIPNSHRGERAGIQVH